MSAYVANDGKVTKLDGRKEPDEVVTPDDVQDPKKLAELLARALREVTELKRRWAPRRMVFRDLVVNGGAMTPDTVRLQHGFGGRVVWWVCDTDFDAPRIRYNDATTEDVLVLKVYDGGTLSICVEEAG